jgi:hypothetical protein
MNARPVSKSVSELKRDFRTTTMGGFYISRNVGWEMMVLKTKNKFRPQIFFPENGYKNHLTSL